MSWKSVIMPCCRMRFSRCSLQDLYCSHSVRYGLPERKKTNPRYNNDNNNNNNNNSFVRFNSKDQINENNIGEFNPNFYQKAFLTNYKYRSFHEENTEIVNNKNVNINNINSHGSNLDKNLNIDENMKQFEISSINSNSNKQNFMEENTDTELNKFFGIANSDKDSQKARRSKDLKNYSLYNYLKEDNSFRNYKTMNITAGNKQNLDNQNILNSLYNINNNNSNQNNYKQNNLTTLNAMNKNNKKNSSNPPSKQEILEPIIDKINFEGFEKDELDKKYFDNKKEHNQNQNKSVKIICKNLSRTIDNNAIPYSNLKDKYLLKTDIKKRNKVFFSDIKNNINFTNTEEDKTKEKSKEKPKSKEKDKKIGKNKLVSLNIDTNNLKVVKNLNKNKEFQTTSNKNFFIKTGLIYHNNKNSININENNLDMKLTVRTNSSKENIKLKETLRISKLKKNQKKSAAHMIINNMKISKEKSNINIYKNRLFLSEKKNNMDNYMKSNIINLKNNRLLLNKHIIIEIIIILIFPLIRALIYCMVIMLKARPIY